MYFCIKIVVQIIDESSSGTSLLYTSSSSASHSSSDSEEDLIVKRARIKDYLEVVPKYTDLQFKQHFRLSRTVAEKVIGM